VRGGLGRILNTADYVCFVRQEAIETSAQTTKEANAGDIQARKLLAKESAAAQTAKK
jgi:hypothetical protein